MVVNEILRWMPTDGADNASACGCDSGTRLIGKAACVKCEEGVHCGLMGVITIEPGYYAEKDLSVYRCAERAACKGGRPGETCVADRVGLACARCKPGMTYGRLHVTCRDCNGWDRSSVWIAIPAWIFMSGVLHLLWHTGWKTGARKAAQSMSASTGGFAIQAIQLFKVFLGIRLDWPPEVKLFLIFSTVLLMDISNLSPECAPGWRHWPPVAEYGTSQLLPVIFVAALGFCGFIRHLLPRWLKIRVPMFTLINIISTSGLVWQCLVVMIASSALNAIKCLRHPNGLETLIAHPAIHCWTSAEHRTIFSLGVMSISANVCLPSAFVFWSMWVVPRRVTNASFREATRFMFFKFLRDRYWYSIAQIARSLAFATVTSLFSGAFSQVAACLGLLVVGLCMHLTLLPYSKWLSNHMETSMLVSLIFFLIFGFYFIPKYADSSYSNTLMRFMLTIVVVYALVLLVVFAAKCGMACFPGLARTNRSKLASDLLQSMRVACMMLAGLSDSDGIKFLSDLSYMDRFYLRKVLDLTMLELCALNDTKSSSSPRLPHHVPEGTSILRADSYEMNRIQEDALGRLLSFAASSASTRRSMDFTASGSNSAMSADFQSFSHSNIACLNSILGAPDADDDALPQQEGTTEMVASATETAPEQACIISI